MAIPSKKAHKMISVLLVDDHSIVRYGLRQMLSADGFDIVGEAKTGVEAIAMTHKMRPDVVLMDLNMPDMDGFSASLLLLNSTLHVKILVMSTQESPIVPVCLLKSGVLGYISKGVDSKILTEAIKAVSEGKQYFENHRFLIDTISNSALATLSSRELQIVLMITRGVNTRSIAEKICLSQKTVQANLRVLLKKLGLKNTIALVHLAIQQKLLDPDMTQLAHEHRRW